MGTGVREGFDDCRLRNLPLAEEGIYSFGISLGADPPVTITVPVLLQPRPAHVRVH
jgi:hypothetical protein